MKSLVIIVQRTILWIISIIVAFLAGFVVAAAAIEKEALVAFVEVFSERLSKRYEEREPEEAVTS